LSSSAGLSARELALATFGYPAVIEYLGYWMVTGWPLLTLVVVGASIRLWSRFLPERSDASSLFIVGAVVAPTVLSALAISYHESRYVFHLYPVMLALAAWAMVWIATRALRELRTGTPFRRCVAALALAAVALVFMEDGHPGAAWGIGVRTYSDERDRARSPISWSAYAHFHQDLKSPSLHVRENRSPEDRVIAMAPPHTVAVYHFYIGGVDYVLGRPRDRSYYRRIGDRLVGWVTGSEVIEDAAAVEALRSEIHGTVWLLADWPLLDEGNGYYPESVRAYARGLGREPDYVGLDGQTFVVKLQPRDAAGRGRSEAAP
jgi:hypothetical protein